MSMNNFLKSLMVILLVTASAQAMVWTGGANTDDWLTGGNWDTGNPPTPADFLTVVNVVSPALSPVINETVPTIGSSSTTGIEVGTATAQGTLYIADGAAIELSSSYGYHRIPANGLVQQTGGSVNARGNCWLSRNTGGMNSLYEITGGTFTFGNGKSFAFLNRRTDCQARINVFGGEFKNHASWRVTDSTYYPAMDATWGVTVKDSGLFVWPWTEAQTIGYVTSVNQNLKSGSPKQGLVLKWAPADTSYQQGGTYNPYYMTATVANGVSTLLTPLNNAATPPGSTVLQWLNADPYFDGTTMTRYVRFGTYDVNETTGEPTDPNGDDLPIVATLTANEPNTIVACVYGENYQWRVDSVDPGNGSDANYPKTISTVAHYIVCKNQAPVVTIPAAATLAIGLKGGSVAWTTTATAKDDGLPIGGPALTFAWTQVGGPAVTINNAATPSPSVTMTAANTYTFRCSVSDSDLIGTADVAVTVYVNVCEASKVRTGYTAAAGDLNADCWVTFADAALLAANWLTCNSLVACY